MDSIPGSGGFPWRKKWQPALLFLPEQPHGQRTWRATVNGVAKSGTQLSMFWERGWDWEVDLMSGESKKTTHLDWESKAHIRLHEVYNGL